MATPIALVSVPRPSVRTHRARSSWWRAGVCVASLSLSGSAAFAATGNSPPTAVEPPGPGLPPTPLPGGDPTFPREPDPTGIDIPDEVTADQLKGKYGIGLGLLILGGVLTAGALIALLLLVVRRPWTGAHSR